MDLLDPLKFKLRRPEESLHSSGDKRYKKVGPKSGKKSALDINPWAGGSQGAGTAYGNSKEGHNSQYSKFGLGLRVPTSPDSPKVSTQIKNSQISPIMLSNVSNEPLVPQPRICDVQIFTKEESISARKQREEAPGHVGHPVGRGTPNYQ